MKRRSLFRPCIDLHNGKVKQIVGSTLRDGDSGPTENFVSAQSPAWFAETYRADDLHGGHVIKLGPGNEEAARSALAAYPGGLQIGGGITLENARDWLDAGASHVIVTSWLFDQNGHFQAEHLASLVSAISARRIVVDLSCKRTSSGWTVAMNRWQTLTNLPVTTSVLDRLADSCDEFLIHAADVEGLCAGVDRDLIELLGGWGKRPVTYAGGIANLGDVQLVDDLSGGQVDFTVGSALDLFGGSGVSYAELVALNRSSAN